MGTINLAELKEFLIEANKPHASGTAKATREADNSRSISFSQGDYRMHDNFFGGEPYGGRLVVFYKELPVFLEVYYGQTTRPASAIYNFLREALRLPGEDNPFRGPATYSKGTLTYRRIKDGDLSSHIIKEYIYDGNEEVYRATIIGGLIDQGSKNAM